MQIRSDFYPPIPIGGYLQIKNKHRKSWGDKGELHIVTEVQVNGVNDYAYATDRVAWLNSAHVEYKHPPDKKSITKIAEGIDE